MFYGIYIFLLSIRNGQCFKNRILKNCFLYPKSYFHQSSIMSQNRSNNLISSKEIKENFIKYFESKNHVHWPGASVVPYNDPSLLFVNAGMNQFKQLINGNVDKDSALAKLVRACNFQRCIRAGGKHNDLDDVGKDSYHHTFFEMLGNWSFGDYLKEDAIAYAWDLLTNVYKLNSDRLYATYFGGGGNLPPDLESKKIWLKYLPEGRVLPFGAKDNFWEMAETGPCGPCTEIHYDYIGDRDASSIVNADSPDVVEIWNLVFMEYNREADGTFKLLPKKCVDTGMGFERLVSVINGYKSNYDSDIFRPIHDEIKNFFPNIPSYAGKFGDEDKGLIDTTYRVISDHIRCLVVAISDGAEPSNEGRGYVLRRIIRRAVVYGKLHFNANEKWLYRLVPLVASLLGIDINKVPEIERIINSEESLFYSTLDKGVDRFNKICSSLKAGDIISGKNVFLLYSSFGFPPDLTQIMASERGIFVDTEGFDRALVEHQRASESCGSSGAGLRLTASLSSDLIERLGLDLVGTDDSFKYDWGSAGGVGPSIGCRVMAIWDGHQFTSFYEECGGTVSILMDRTPFYAEAGGQVSDVGHFELNSELYFTVKQVDKIGSFVLHTGVPLQKVSVGDVVQSRVSYEVRSCSAKNHTATHILNFCISKILPNVNQQGSLVDPEKLRFDYNTPSPLDHSQLLRLSNSMNSIVDAKLPVSTHVMSIGEAMKINGIRAMFGETYPETVRVLAIGELGNLNGEEMSIELCGGTHVSNTSEIGSVLIVSDEAIAKGIRRIICITGKKALEATDRMNSYRAEYENALEEIRKGRSEKSTEFETSKRSIQNRDLLVNIKATMEKDKYLPLIDRKKLYEEIDASLKLEWDQIKKYQKGLLAATKNILSKDVNEYPTEKDESGANVYIIRADDLHGDMKHMMTIAQNFAKKNKVNVLVLSSLPQSQIIESFVCVSSNEELKCGNFVKTMFKGKNITFDHESHTQASGQIYNSKE